MGRSQEVQRESDTLPPMQQNSSTGITCNGRAERVCGSGPRGQQLASRAPMRSQSSRDRSLMSVVPCGAGKARSPSCPCSAGCLEASKASLPSALRCKRRSHSIRATISPLGKQRQGAFRVNTSVVHDRSRNGCRSIGISMEVKLLGWFLAPYRAYTCAFPRKMDARNWQLLAPCRTPSRQT
jgi:hypothetical protein